MYMYNDTCKHYTCHNGVTPPIQLQTKHSTMLDMTARLAIEMRNLPDWEVDWDDVTPQRLTLTISDLLPGEADGVELQKRAVVHVMRVLVEEFPALSYLDALLPTEESPDISRSNVVPMKILFKDEKYIAETTEILTRLSGKPEVHMYKIYM